MLRVPRCSGKHEQLHPERQLESQCLCSFPCLLVRASATGLLIGRKISSWLYSSSSCCSEAGPHRCRGLGLQRSWLRCTIGFLATPCFFKFGSQLGKLPLQLLDSCGRKRFSCKRCLLQIQPMTEKLVRQTSLNSCGVHCVIPGKNWAARSLSRSPTR
jgi:hypothetical protein